MTSPAVPPYSSSTTARCTFSFFMSARTSSTSRVPGTNSGGRMMVRTVASGELRSADRMSFACTTPTMSSRLSVNTG